jgi:hypothetical protein
MTMSIFALEGHGRRGDSCPEIYGTRRRASLQDYRGSGCSIFASA